MRNVVMAGIRDRAPLDDTETRLRVAAVAP